MEITQKTKIRIIISSSNPTPAHLPRENHDSKRHMHSSVHSIAKTWKQPKCPLTVEWINMCYIYTMEYYSAIKRKEIIAFAATWMDLEIIMLSDVRPVRHQNHIDSTYMWSLKEGHNELP